MIEPDMKHISQDRPEDPCVDDDMVLDIVVWHRNATIPHLILTSSVVFTIDRCLT